MSSCYYCVDYFVEENKCSLFNREPETSDNDCGYFEFDTGIQGLEEKSNDSSEKRLEDD